MARVRRGVIAKARHKKVLKKAKGYYGARSKLFKTASVILRILSQWFNLTALIRLLTNAPHYFFYLICGNTI